MAYVVIVLSLTWLAWADPYAYAYWAVRDYVALLVHRLVLRLFPGHLAFGPAPTTWAATFYFFAVAIAGAAMQLAIAWVVRNRAR